MYSNLNPDLLALFGISMWALNTSSLENSAVLMGLLTKLQLDVYHPHTQIYKHLVGSNITKIMRMWKACGLNENLKKGPVL